MLYYKYKLTDKYKLPTLCKNNYDFYYEKIQFNIYKVSKETLIIEQIFNNKTFTKRSGPSASRLKPAGGALAPPPDPLHPTDGRWEWGWGERAAPIPDSRSPDPSYII